MKEWNDGYIHEGADRCHVIMTMIDELLIGHPSVEKAKITKNLEKAQDIIYDCYQKIWDLEQSKPK